MKVAKKFAAILLALVMCCSLAVSAFAASSPETTGSITVNDAEKGEIYSIYQIFDLTYEDDGDSYSYKVVDAWEDFISGYTITVVGEDEEETEVSLFTLDSHGYLDPDSAIFDYEDDAEVLASFAQAALEWATGEVENDNGDMVARIEATASREAGLDGPTKVTFMGLDLGWYLVDSTLGSLCILTSTDPSGVVNEKNSVPTLSKWIDVEGRDQEDVENASEHTYLLEIDNIKGVVNLKLDDIMDPEIEMDKDTLAIKIIDGETEIELEEDEDYTYTLTKTTEDQEIADHTYVAGSNELIIDFTGYDFSDVSDEAYIEITYTCTVETEDDAYEGDEDDLHNVAMITYGAAGESEWEEVEVDLFGFEIFKYTESTTESVHEFEADRPTAPPNGTATDYYYLYYVDENNTTQYVKLTKNSDGTYTYQETTETQPASEDEDSVYGFLTISSDEDTPDSYIIYGLPNYTYSVGHLTEHGQEGQQTSEYTLTRSSGETALAGAEFEVTDSEGKTAYFEYEEGTGKYILEGWLAEGEEVPTEDDNGNKVTYTTKLVSGTDGMIYVEGLTYGTYTLTETKAPDGYNLLTDTITVIIDEYGNVFYSTGDLMNEDNLVADKTIRVENNAGSELPSTGGIGTTIFYVVGCILVLGAVVVLVTRKRMGRE